MGMSCLAVVAISSMSLCIGATAAQHTPPSKPPSSAGAPASSALYPSLGGASTDCYVGNGTACVYSFGQCQVDSDCTAVLAASLATYHISEPPSDAEFVCYMFKCDLATPSTTCATDLALPICGAAVPTPAPAAAPNLGPLPASRPVSQSSASAPALGPGAVVSSGSAPPGYAPQPPPQAVFPALCAHDVLGTGRGCCVEFGGSCRTFRDCIPSIAAYLLALPDHLSEPPGDSLPACYAGFCYYASQSTNCSVLGPPPVALHRWLHVRVFHSK